jgi:tetratricopeptide (TPR) repeat protein
MTAQPVSVSRGCNTGVAAHNAICIHQKFAQTGLGTFQMPRETRSARPGSARVGDAAPSVRAVQKGVFRKEGEYWTVGYGGKAFRLKDSKGLGYLAHLLRHPGAEFHVLDLAGGIADRRDDDEAGQSEQGLPRGGEELEKAGIHIGSLGDAGEMLDEQAKVAYRRRLSELREELEEAKERGNVERAEQAEQEIDALTRELSRAVGLGGRNRRAISASERARQTISKTIKSVLDRIAQSDATLGDFFARCIKTGTFCSYAPDPEFPIAWEFAATTIEPADQPTSSDDPATAPADHRQVPPAVLEVSPFSFAERTAFLGRESEVSAIRAVIDRALGGHGSLVILGGGPGVGKTRLAMEMSEYASHVGFRCFVGHCYERDEPFPFLPFVEIIEGHLAQAASLEDHRRRIGDNAAELAQIAPSLRRVFPDIPQPLELPPAQKRRYLFQSVSEALARAAQTRSYLYILDDLQWADESSLALLIHLANRIAQLPVVIIGTYRDGYSDTNPALVRTLEELIRLGVRPLRLGGLSKDAVAQMLHGSPQRHAPESLVNAIFEESQGNPFFVEEVYRHLVEEGKVFDATGQFRTDIKIDEIDVPENVRLIIGRRLERFDEHEKRALAAAAVIGRSFSFQLLTSSSRVDVDELFTVIEKAQQMGIIIPSSEGPERPFTFTHELVRQTLLAAISAPRRQRMHASVAEAIELVYPSAATERAGEITDHLLKAGSFVDRQKLVRWLTLAGKSALKAAAFEEARRNFQSALSHKGAVEARERTELLASLAMAERGLDQWDAVIAHLREVLEIYINLDDRKMIGRSFTELAAASIWAGRFQEATETGRRGLTYLQAEVSADRARLLATLAQALAAAGVYQPADEALREALNIASQLSDPKLEAGLLGVRPIINIQFFRLRETVTDGLLSKQPGGSDLPPWPFVLQLLILHQVLLYLGRPEEALRIADELEPLARKIGQSLSVGFCLSTRALIDFGKAPDLAKLEAGFQRVRKSDGEPSFAHLEVVPEVQLGLVDFFRGNWTSALSHAQASRRLELGSCMEGLGVGMVFRQLTYAGDRDGALAILDEKRALLPRSDQTNTAGSWLMLALVIEGLVILGDHSQAGQLYPLICELIGTGPVVLWPIFRFTQTITGVAAAAARQWDAAEEHFQIAMRQAESFPNVLEQTEIRRFHAMMLIDRAAPGDREKAQTLLRDALESYTQIGMPRHLEMTQALLGKITHG